MNFCSYAPQYQLHVVLEIDGQGVVFQNECDMLRFLLELCSLRSQIGELLRQRPPSSKGIMPRIPKSQ